MRAHQRLYSAALSFIERIPRKFPLLLSILFLILHTLPALAFTVPEQSSSLARKSFTKGELQVSFASEPLRNVRHLMPPAHADALARITEKQGHAFHLQIDPRSGIPTTVIGHIPIIPGSGRDNRVRLEDLSQALGQPVAAVDPDTVSRLMKKFIRENLDLLNLDGAQLGGVKAAKVSDQLWQMHVTQEVKGVKVRGAHLAATISHGNLVLFGTERWGDVHINTNPKIQAEEALSFGFQYAGGQMPTDRVVNQPTLEIVPVAPQHLQDGDRYTGPMGKGYEHRLVWTFTFKRPPELPTWEVIIDAQSGEILSFLDINQYATSGITGGVYPLANTGICPAYTCCGVMQTEQPMPFTDTGLPAPNDFTNSAGLFSYESGEVATSLFGKYVRINDNCGPLSEGAYGSGGLNLGGANNQHNCDSGGASAGNTAAARTSFYELNRIMELARGYLPANNWLQGTLLSSVNIDDICNAYWDGVTVNFFKGSAGCRNTGEIAGVFDHEWGHGLDYNDLNSMGQPGEVSRPGEAYADIVAMYRLQTSCIGYGFYGTRDQGCGQTADGTGQNAENIGIWWKELRCARNCSGVRETDWTQLTGPENTPDTPANFACTRCSDGGSGPCGRQTHCESAVDTQAAWDFVARDLQSPPFGYDATTAFLTANRIFYQAAGNIGSWHTCSCTGATSNGCGATNAYMQWLAADDDDGDISNGTPHMTALYNAFNRHAIACDTPAPVNSGCAGGPTEAPTLTITPGTNQVALSWSTVPSAAEYRMFRSEGAAGCSSGKTPIATVTGTTHTDPNLANGQQYCYTVMATGSSDACFTPASACLCATPAAAPYGTLQGSVTDSVTGDPLGGALVTMPGGYAATTDNSGMYSISGLPAGTYEITASALGHQPQTAPGVLIATGETTIRNFPLAPQTLVTVQGVVTDGSGHGWPLYATIEITAPGYAHSIYTDRETGSYSIELHAGTTYQFKVTSGGYVSTTRQITPSIGGNSEYFVLTVDPLSCAPGYGSLYLERFEHGTGGYTVSKEPGEFTNGFSTWEWGIPLGYPRTAHSGTKAWGTNLTGFYMRWENGYITSPIIDLSRNSGQPSILSWWQWLEFENGYDVPSVEVSNDGGATWTTIYVPSGDMTSWTNQEIELAPSYSVSSFRIRFHFTSDTYIEYPGWYIDDLSVRPKSGCQLEAGGLLVGNVYDRSTGAGVSIGTVSAGSGLTTITAATPDDPGLDDGYYSLFIPAGAHAVIASAPGYLPQAPTTVTISGNTITRQNIAIVRQLSITTSSLPAAVTGTPYSQTAAATGGVPPHTWAITSGALPAGLTLNSATGTIAGTPAAAGTAAFTIRVTDSLGSTGSKALTLITRPTVISYQPASGAVVHISATAQATFSDPLDPATVTTGSFILSNDGWPPKAIAGGTQHSMALKADGTVFSWGTILPGQETILAGLSGVTAIAAGSYFSLALKADSTVVAWGYNDFGQTEVPAGLTGVTAIAAKNFHSLALKGDGTVVAWGNNEFSQIKVPKGLAGVTAIAAGGFHSLVLKGDGTVDAWGWGAYGQATVPAGLTDVIAIAAGYAHSVALKRDGTVVAWGRNTDVSGNYLGQATVPAGLFGVVAIAAGSFNSLALKSDGTVVAWGDNFYDQTTFPAGLTGVIAIAMGDYHALALKNDQTVVAWGANHYAQAILPAHLNAREKGTVSYDAITRTATFTPSAPLIEGITYHATVAGVTSQNGVGLAPPFTWSFRTHDLKIITFALPDAPAGTGYSQTLGVAGGVAPYTWSIAAGTLPAWASLDSATGLISGTPTVAGSHTFTVQVTDAAGIAVSKAFTLVTNPIVTGYLPPNGAVVPTDTIIQATFSDPLDPATIIAGSFFLSGNLPPRAIAAGGMFNLALKSNGTVATWGLSAAELTVPAGLTGVVAISAGRVHSLVLKSDSTVVAWGYDSSG